MQLPPTCCILGKELLRALEITSKNTSRWDNLQTNTTNQSNIYRWCFQKLNHLLSPCNFAFKCHTKYHLIYFSMTGLAAPWAIYQEPAFTLCLLQDYTSGECHAICKFSFIWLHPICVIWPAQEKQIAGALVHPSLQLQRLKEAGRFQHCQPCKGRTQFVKQINPTTDSRDTTCADAIHYAVTHIWIFFGL